MWEFDKGSWKVACLLFRPHIWRCSWHVDQAWMQTVFRCSLEFGENGFDLARGALQQLGTFVLECFKKKTRKWIFWRYWSSVCQNRQRTNGDNQHHHVHPSASWPWPLHHTRATSWIFAPESEASEHCADFFKMHKFVTYGGAFGGPSVKPLQLWGTHLVFKNLKERGLIPIYLKIPWQHGQVVVDLPVILGCWQSQLNTHPCLVRKWLSVMPVFCQQLAFSPLTLTRLWLVTIILIHWRWRNVAVCAGLSSPLFCNVSSFKSTIGPELDLRRLRLMILCHKSFGKRWNWTNIKPTWNCVIFKMKSCFRLSQAGPATACGNLGLG